MGETKKDGFFDKATARKVKKVVNKHPELSADAVAELLFTSDILSESSRKLLFEGVLFDGVSEEDMEVVIESVRENESMTYETALKLVDLISDTEVNNEELTAKSAERILKRPFSSETALKLLEIVAETEVNDEELTAKSAERILKRPISSETALKILDSVYNADVADGEFGVNRLEYIISKTESKEEQLFYNLVNQPMDKDRRNILFESLLKKPLPKESVPGMIDALIDSKAMTKEYREKILDFILSYPINDKYVRQFIEKFHFQYAYAPGVTDDIKAIREFSDISLKLKPWVDTGRPQWKDNFKAQLSRVLYEGVSTENALLDLICEGNICHLKDADIEFIDRKQLWGMIEKLLFAEEYYLDYDNNEPLILDCGTNIGLAIYYYKHRYPNARVVGFEPWSVAYECALRNVERNNWSNVVIHNIALDKTEGIKELYTVDENSLAGSITNRLDKIIERNNWKKNIEQVDVKKLSGYINEPVDFVKMDIEGVENRVLREIEDKLDSVKNIFVEYHYGETLEDNSLADILAILERKGFVYAVSKSKAYEKSTYKRPFRKVGENVSELIWAKRR